jgi:hypothetical protein
MWTMVANPNTSTGKSASDQFVANAETEAEGLRKPPAGMIGYKDA